MWVPLYMFQGRMSNTEVMKSRFIVEVNFTNLAIVQYFKILKTKNVGFPLHVSGSEVKHGS